VWQTLKDQFHLFGPVSMLVASLAAGILAYVIVILKTNEQDGAIVSGVTSSLVSWVGAVIFWAFGAVCGSLVGWVLLLNTDPQDQAAINELMDASILWGRQIGKYAGVLFTVIIAANLAIKEWKARRTLSMDVDRAETARV
jgi:hypothetical protein